MTKTRSPHCYFLVGFPGSGKSTWATERFLIPITGTDKWVNILAQQCGKTYTEVFSDVIPEATQLFDKEVEALVDARRSFIWDQTNLTVKSRASKIARLVGYEITAVVFDIDADELHRRQSQRVDKVIPKRVLLQMAFDYQCPTVDEGFARVNIIKV